MNIPWLIKYQKSKKKHEMLLLQEFSTFCDFLPQFEYPAPNSRTVELMKTTKPHIMTTSYFSLCEFLPFL